MQTGRLTPVNFFSRYCKGLSVNVGSKSTDLGDVNLDIAKNDGLDVLASVLKMPFNPNTFSFAYFTEVMEHLPANTEQEALEQINRSLKEGGLLFLSVPNDYGLWKYLDPVYFLQNHRHYKQQKVIELLKNSSFQVCFSFTAGGFWEILSNLVYCFFLFPLKKLSANTPSGLSFLEKLATKEFVKVKPLDGNQLFVLAAKV